MRISDWSSDVCSSDLPGTCRFPGACGHARGTRSDNSGRTAPGGYGPARSRSVACPRCHRTTPRKRQAAALPAVAGSACRGRRAGRLLRATFPGGGFECGHDLLRRQLRRRPGWLRRNHRPVHVRLPRHAVDGRHVLAAACHPAQAVAGDPRPGQHELRRHRVRHRRVQCHRQQRRRTHDAVGGRPARLGSDRRQRRRVAPCRRRLHHPGQEPEAAVDRPRAGRPRVGSAHAPCLGNPARLPGTRGAFEASAARTAGDVLARPLQRHGHRLLGGPGVRALRPRRDPRQRLRQLPHHARGRGAEHGHAVLPRQPLQHPRRPERELRRELMELHTFGSENYLGFVDPFQVPPCPEDPSYPIGYTDVDVYETAAAFTGWTVKDGHWEFPTEDDGTFVYRSSWHDAGPKFPLGMFLNPEQPALKDGRDILDRIASHPRVAKFICKKLIRRFCADRPSQQLIDSAAAVFRANWQEPDQIKRTLRHILLSDAAFNNWGQKRRRPFEAVAAALRLSGSDWTPNVDDDKSGEFSWRMGFTGHTPYDWPAPNGYPDTAVAWSGSNSFGMTWKLLNWLSETKDADVPLLPILEATRSGVSQWTSTNLVDFWCRRLLGYLPARRGVLVDFMRQNGAAGDVIADTDSWAGNDLKRHYNQQRLRSMVSLVLMSPEFLAR